MHSQIIVFCAAVAKRRDSSFVRNLNTPDSLSNQRLIQIYNEANNFNKNNNTHSEEVYR